MVVLYEVSAEELAQIEGGYFLKFVWIDLQWTACAGSVDIPPGARASSEFPCS
jgi:hypothetical protein